MPQYTHSINTLVLQFNSYFGMTKPRLSAQDIVYLDIREICKEMQLPQKERVKLENWQHLIHVAYRELYPSKGVGE